MILIEPFIIQSC